MLRAYKYSIYPTGTQREFLAKTFGCSRFVWNLMLSEKLNAYNNRKVSLLKINKTNTKEVL